MLEKSLCIDYLKIKLENCPTRKKKEFLCKLNKFYNFEFEEIVDDKKKKQSGRPKRSDKREKKKCEICGIRQTTKQCSECYDFVCGDDVKEVCMSCWDKKSSKKGPRKPKINFAEN